MSGASDPGSGSPGGSGTSPEAVPPIEARVARVLTLGTRLAIGLLAVGSVLLVANGISPLAEDWPPLDVASLATDLLATLPERD